MNIAEVAVLLLLGFLGGATMMGMVWFTRYMLSEPKKTEKTPPPLNRNRRGNR